jgi:hypothetical protein
VPLRPLGLGELFDGAVRTMRQNPRVMFGVSAAVMAIGGVIASVGLLFGARRLVTTLAGTGDGLSRDEVAAAATSGLVTFVVPAVLEALATIVLTGILIIAVSEAVLGRRPSPGQVLGRVAPRILALLGVSLVTAAIVLLLLLVCAVPGAVLLLTSHPLAGGIALALAVPAVVVVGAFLWVRLAFAAPALLLEQLGVRRSLSRSWRLTVGSWWRVFGILLLTTLVATVAGGLLSAPFALIGGVVGGAVSDGSAADERSFLVSQLLGNLGSVLASTVTAPFTAAVTALLYIDLRIRREGLDVGLARAAAESAGSAAPASPTS